MAMFSTTSCERDDTSLETIQEQPQFKIEKLTGSQLTNNHSLNKALNSAKESLGINTFQKSVYDSINGFYIEDTDVNYLSSGTYESYTFKIIDPSDTTHLKNMVFSKQKDSTYQAFIVAYDLNYITLDDIRQGSIPVDATPYVRYTPVTSSFQHKNGVVMIGEGDWRRAQEATLVFYMEPCGGGDLLPSNGDVNPGGDFPNDPGPPTGGQTNPGGSGQLPLINNNTNEPDGPCNDQLTLSNGDCAGVITSPVIDLKPAPSEVDDDTQAFFDSLEQTDEELWRFINDSDHDDLRNDTDNFLVDENHSDEAKNFAEEAIKAKQENENVKIDYDEKIINNLSQNRSEHSKIIENIKNQTGPITQIINTIFNANHNPNNLIFSEVPSGGNNATDIAWSNDNGAGTFEILITSNFLDNATDLAFVMTIMHEMMHTNLSYLNQKDELPYQNIQPNLEHHEYPILIQEFLTYTADNNQGNDTDHEFMAENYLDLLSDAVYNWAITPIADGGGGYDVNDQTLRPHLDRLAWAGLSQSNFFNYPGAPPFGGGNPFLTPAWQDLVNSDPTLAQLILDTLAAEIHPNDIRVNQQLVLGNNF